MKDKKPKKRSVLTLLAQQRKAGPMKDRRSPILCSSCNDTGWVWFPLYEDPEPYLIRTRSACPECQDVGDENA